MIARGEVWWAELGNPRGSAPAYRHPVVIISSDEYNSRSIATAIVAVITTNPRLAVMPGNTLLPRGTAGLTQDSVVNVTQIVTVARADIDDHVGTLPRALMQQVDQGLRLALDLTRQSEFQL